MAVGVVIDVKGGTLDQYDEVIKKMGFTPGGAGPTGLISGWVTKTPEGIRLTEVWETREYFDRFAEDKIGPITQEVGVPGPPEITFHEVHNHLTAGTPAGVR
jgi:hypothetical protein